MTITCFLRLDGVLHPAGSNVDSHAIARVLRMGSEPFEWARWIAEVAERAELEFVICSPWLQKTTLQQLREQAPEWMSPRIVGACEPFGELDGLQHVHRHTALWTVVDNYVQTHGIKHWLAVDCTADGWPADVETRQRLVLCDAETGLGDQQALNSFTEAVRRERRWESDHYSATFALSLHDECPLAVQERWQVDFWLRSFDDVSPVLAVLFDELVSQPQTTVALDRLGKPEAIAGLALRTLCAARFGAPDSATDWRPHYRWNRISFSVESAGLLPVGRSWLHLVVEVRGDECRVSYRHEDGWVECYWHSLTEEDEAPLALLTRAVTTALDAERRLPC